MKCFGLRKITHHGRSDSDINLFGKVVWSLYGIFWLMYCSYEMNQNPVFDEISVSYCTASRREFQS